MRSKEADLAASKIMLASMLEMPLSEVLESVDRVGPEMMKVLSDEFGSKKTGVGLLAMCLVMGRIAHVVFRNSDEDPIELMIQMIRVANSPAFLKVLSGDTVLPN